jgi:hypothetical protein
MLRSEYKNNLAPRLAFTLFAIHKAEKNYVLYLLKFITFQSYNCHLCVTIFYNGLKSHSDINFISRHANTSRLHIICYVVVLDALIKKDLHIK